MKKMKLLFTLAITVILTQNLQAQSVVEKTSTTISRLIGSSHWYSNGAWFYVSDSSVFSYTNPRGGDLFNTLKYDSWNNYYYSNIDSLFHPNTLNQQAFDGNNNIISNQHLLWYIGTGWVAQTKNLYFYDTSNKMTSQTYQTWGGSTWSPANKNEYTYVLGTNMLSQDLYLSWNSATTGWDQVSEKLYTYDGSSNLIQELDMIMSGISWINTTQYNYSYTSGNKVISKTSSSWDGANWIYSDQYNYTYDSTSGNLSSITYQTYNTTLGTWVNSSLKLFSSGTYPATEYDNVWIDTASGGSGAWGPSIKYDYSYNSYGQLTKQVGTSWNISGVYENKVGDPLNYYYYEVVNLSVGKELENKGFETNVFPVPAQNVLNINISSNVSQVFNITITDMAGRIMRSWSIPSTELYSTTIPTDNMTAGNYIVKISSEKGSTTKQISIIR